MCVNTWTQWFVVWTLFAMCKQQFSALCSAIPLSCYLLLATHFWGNDGDGPILGLVFLSQLVHVDLVVSYESTQHHNMCTVESTAHCALLMILTIQDYDTIRDNKITVLWRNSKITQKAGWHQSYFVLDTKLKLNFRRGHNTQHINILHIINLFHIHTSYCNHAIDSSESKSTVQSFH